MCTLANNEVSDVMPHYVAFPQGVYYLLMVMKKAKIRKQNNQVQFLTQDTTWKSNNNTRTNYIQESQEVRHLPECIHKAARNRQGSMKKADTSTNTKKKINKRSNTLERSIRILLEGSNMYDDTNLTLITDVNQDT